MQTPIKIAIGSTSSLVFIIVIGWFVFPNFLKGQIKSNVCLKKGNDVREMYLKVPFPLIFKVYMFNVTNPVEVTNGRKPHVQQIGPFVYDEYKEKVDIEENEEDDTMTYTIKNSFMFNKELTAPLSGDEIITIPHPLLAGLVMAVEREQPSAMGLINKAMKSIHNNPETPFITGKVSDLLFNGFLIYCNVTDFAGKGVCSQLKDQAKGLIEVEPGIFSLSLFGPNNATKAQRVKVKRGIENIRDLGKVIEFEGEKKIDIWLSKECNTFQGTDSTIFPPFLTKEEGLISFAPDLCRSLSAYYVKESKYAGIPVREYTADFGDQSTKKEDKCYCPTADTCLKKGVFDLYKCVKAPFLASLPHFYKADLSYVNSVDGLNPNEAEHAIFIYFESFSGAPLSARKRMQFALPLHAQPKIECMKNLPDTTIPMFWVEEGVDLNATWTKPLKNQLFRTMKIVKVLKYIILFASLGGLGAAGYLMYGKKEDVSVKPVIGDNNNVESKRNQVLNMISQNGSNGKPRLVGQANPALNENEIDKF